MLNFACAERTNLPYNGHIFYWGLNRWAFQMQLFFGGAEVLYATFVFLYDRHPMPWGISMVSSSEPEGEPGLYA